MPPASAADTLSLQFEGNPCHANNSSSTSFDKDIETREVIQSNVPGFPGEDEGQSDGFVFSKETNSDHETMRHRYVGGQTFARPPVVSVSTEN